MRIATSVTRLLGIDLPILAAGPAEFAAAVSEAGGLGVLAADAPDAAEAAIDHVRAATSRPFAIRLPPDASADTMGAWLNAVLAHPVPVLITAGRLHAQSARIRAAGHLHLHAAASLEQAHEAVGADALRSEGLLVDGLLVDGNAWTLLPVLAATHPGLPLVAPGSTSGSGLAAALALGAGAVLFTPLPSEPGADLVRRIATEYATTLRALPVPSVTPPRDPGRAAREAGALRENLRKRKEQARARMSQF